MRYGLRIATLLLSAALIGSLAGAPAAATDDTAPAGDATLQVDAGGSTTLTFLASLCGASGVALFDDVDRNDYGAEHIRCARALGLSRGLGDGTFGADRLLTRAQMATFLVRLIETVRGALCPLESSSPFLDVSADSVHADDIACLVSLGIASGTSATTFSPAGKVTGNQTSLFLMRLFDYWRDSGASFSAAPDRCLSAPVSSNYAAELQRATGCLKELKVIPVDGQLGSPMTRSQMAVYLVGMAYVLAFDEVMPLAPPKDDAEDEGFPGAFKGVSPRDLPREIEIPVVVCAPAGVSFEQFLTRMVAHLNEEESPHFSWQSSGMLKVSFTSGGVVTPDEPWAEVWPDVPYLDLSWPLMPPPCFDLARKRTGTDSFHTFLYASGRDTGGAAGRAWLRRGGGVTYVADIHGSEFSEIYSSNIAEVVSHELHHALLGVFHPFGFSTHVQYIDGASFLEDFLPRPEGFDPRDYHYRLVGDRELLPKGVSRVFTCQDRERLGWPIGNGTAPCARFHIPRLDRDLRIYKEITFAKDGAVTVEIASESEDVNIYVLLEEELVEKIGPTSYISSRKKVDKRILTSGTEFLIGYQFEPGRLYRLTAIPFRHDFFGVAVETPLTAMAVPEEVTVVNRSWTGQTDEGRMKHPQFEISWPDVANVSEYRYLVAGRGYVWDLPGGAASGQGGYFTRENTAVLTDHTGLRLGQPADLRIDACFGTKCVPYARVTLPAVTPLAERSPEQPGVGDPDNAVSNVHIVDFIARQRFGDGMWDTSMELAWDPVPGASFYWVGNPIYDPSVSPIPHGTGDAPEYDVNREYDLNRSIRAWFPETNSVKLYFLQPNTQYRFELWACPAPLDELDVISTSECGPRSEVTLTTPAG